MTGYQLNSRSDMFSSANRLVADRLGERPQKKKKLRSRKPRAQSWNGVNRLLGTSGCETAGIVLD